MKINKGEYGYRDSHKKMRVFLTGLLTAAIMAQLIARSFTDSQATKNILTVMAILTVLPMANMASPLIASWKYRTPSEAFHQKMVPYEKNGEVLYDLIVTTKEHVIPLDAAAVHPAGIFAYCTSSRLNTGKAEKELQELLKNNRISLKLRLITDEKSFFRRLDSLKPASEYEDDGTLEYAARLLKNLSM